MRPAGTVQLVVEWAVARRDRRIEVEVWGIDPADLVDDIASQVKIVILRRGQFEFDGQDGQVSGK